MLHVRQTTSVDVRTSHTPTKMTNTPMSQIRTCAVRQQSQRPALQRFPVQRRMPHSLKRPRATHRPLLRTPRSVRTQPRQRDRDDERYGCPYKRWQTPKSRSELTRTLHQLGEPAPCARAEPKGGTGTVLGVADEDNARDVADFHAVTATVAGVTRRSPTWLYVVFHCSAAFKMRSRDASRDSASPRTRLNATPCLRTSDRFSVV
jgi:hypothetical protein